MESRDHQRHEMEKEVKELEVRQSDLIDQIQHYRSSLCYCHRNSVLQNLYFQ